MQNMAAAMENLGRVVLSLAWPPPPFNRPQPVRPEVVRKVLSGSHASLTRAHLAVNRHRSDAMAAAAEVAHCYTLGIQEGNAIVIGFNQAKEA